MKIEIIDFFEHPTNTAITTTNQYTKTVELLKQLQPFEESRHVKSIQFENKRGFILRFYFTQQLVRHLLNRTLGKDLEVV